MRVKYDRRETLSPFAVKIVLVACVLALTFAVGHGMSRPRSDDQAAQGQEAVDAEGR